MKSLLVVLCFVTTIPNAVGQWVIGAETSGPDGVTAAGEAEIRVVPDLVEIALGVESRDPDLTRAREANDTTTAAVIAEAKRHGIDASHITTDYVSIEPGYSPDALKPHIYFVRKSILVTSTNVAAFDSLFPALLTAGASHVHRVRFMTSELRRHRDEARTLACKAAREKAQLLARNLGRTLGEVRRITESSDDWWSSYGSWWGGSGSSAQNVMQSTGASGTSEQSGIAPGQLAIRSRVTVTFDLR